MLRLDLFLRHVRSEVRPITHWMDDAEILARRGESLAGCWALTKDWWGNGKAETSTIHGSFPPWSKMIGSMIENGEFLSPCGEYVVKDSDSEG